MYWKWKESNCDSGKSIKKKLYSVEIVLCILYYGIVRLEGCVLCFIILFLGVMVIDLG